MLVLAFTRSRGEVGVGVDLHDPFAETPGGGRIGDISGRRTGPGPRLPE
jgi:hypothetical protein